MIEIGTKHISTTVVDHTNVAKAVGSGGLDVFATPSMVALMEHAAMTAVAVTCICPAAVWVRSMILFWAMAMHWVTAATSTDPAA